MFKSEISLVIKANVKQELIYNRRWFFKMVFHSNFNMGLLNFLKFCTMKVLSVLKIALSLEIFFFLETLIAFFKKGHLNCAAVKNGGFLWFIMAVC